jgi:branched-chain amino acid aminotransferase
VSAVSIDGVIVPEDRAVVSVHDRGFLYGDAIFEALRTYGGEPFALDEHLARLARSAAIIRMALPVDVDAIAREVRAAIASAAATAGAIHGAAPGADWYIRLMVTRGVAPLGLDLDLAVHPTRVILVLPLHLPPRDMYVAGIRAITLPMERPHAAAKQTSYLTSILALADAKARNAREVFFLDAADALLEGTTSNVFVVKHGAVTTPPEGAILAGVTRAHTLAAAGAIGVASSVATVPRAALYDADEVFLTSSIREIVPVVAVDDRPIGTGAPGPITRAIHTAYRARIGTRDAAPWT